MGHDSSNAYLSNVMLSYTYLIEWRTVFHRVWHLCKSYPFIQFAVASDCIPEATGYSQWPPFVYIGRDVTRTCSTWGPAGISFYDDFPALNDPLDPEQWNAHNFDISQPIWTIEHFSESLYNSLSTQTISIMIHRTIKMICNPSIDIMYHAL